MTEAEAIQKAWFVLALGVVLLVFALAQLWAGKAFLGYGWPKLPTWADRKRQPWLFWANLIPLFAAAIFTICISLRVFFRYMP